MRKIILLLLILCLLPTSSWALLKNVGSQTICAELISSTDGSPVTSGTTTVYVVGDGGTQSTGSGTVAHKGNGTWCYTPTQSETNYNHVAFTFVNSSAINVLVQAYTVHQLTDTTETQIDTIERKVRRLVP
jgi:hypothetical protein